VSRTRIAVAYSIALIGCKKSGPPPEPLQIIAHITVADTKSE
jgi:hypothetical protein